MKNKKLLIIVCFVILLHTFIWSPWITKDYAEYLVSKKFTSKWEGTVDGCGFNCDGCGVKESHRTLFGYSVTIEYACGFVPLGSTGSHQTDEIFVSSFGTVHGL